ncbi:MAG: MarR family transcriptional regulator [Bryobacteraceae bacterium]|jgi:DNA-binding MarR family transcriptional regulator
MQEKKAHGRPRRDELVQALNLAGRQASGLGVLFGEAVAARLGINSTDLECLGMVLLNDVITAGEIAKASGLTTGAVTGVIDRLERAGLARREADPKDRRKIHVRPTPKARAAETGPYQSFGKAIDRLVENYSDADVALLIDYFSRSQKAILAEMEKLKELPVSPKLRP